jgi:Glycosyl hydrolase family 47
MGSTVGVLAEMASWQLEYTYLAKASGQKKYLDHVGIILNELDIALTLAGAQPQQRFLPCQPEQNQRHASNRMGHSQGGSGHP